MGRGLTFDTGALIALERRRLRMRKVLQLAHDERRTITVPAAVLAEWWRKRTDLRDNILASVRLEPLNDALAKLAGEALAATRSSNAIDAIVMASAAQRGDVVYTSDHDDLVRFSGVFPDVRVLSV
jgi:predicted nucleic acid-binding protein